MDDRAWTIITDDPIIVDLSECRYLRQIHEVIQKAFGFPGYYGKNLDALWDRMWSFAAGTNGDTEIHICGTGRLPSDLREYFNEFVKVFSDIHEEFPNMNFIIKS